MIAAANLLRRSFVDGPYGQIHVWSTPAVARDHPPVVLLHPAPYSGAYYAPLMRALAQDRRVIALDTPGFGASAPPPEGATLEDYARALSEAIDQLDPPVGRCVDVMGFHTGAMLAVELAIQRPDRVRRLALAGLPFLTGEARSAALQAMGKPTTLDEAGGHLLTYWNIIVGQRHPDVSLADAQRRFNDFMPSFPDGWRAYHALYNYAAEARIALVTQPVLLMLIDEVMRPATLAAAPLFQRSETIDMPDLGKNAFDVGADQIAGVLRGFLGRSEAS